MRRARVTNTDPLTVHLAKTEEEFVVAFAAVQPEALSVGDEVIVDVIDRRVFLVAKENGEGVSEGQIEFSFLGPEFNELLTLAQDKVRLAQQSIFESNVFSAGVVVREALQDLAVDDTKLAAGAVTTEKLVAGSVTTEKLTAESVTAAKLNVASLSASEAVIFELTAQNATIAGELIANSITVGSLDANVIGAGKIDAQYIDVDSITISGDAVVGGTLDVSLIGNGSLGSDIVVDPGDIRSSGYSFNSSGWRLMSDGRARFFGNVIMDNAEIRGNSTFGGKIITNSLDIEPSSQSFLNERLTFGWSSGDMFITPVFSTLYIGDSQVAQIAFGPQYLTLSGGQNDRIQFDADRIHTGSSDNHIYRSFSSTSDIHKYLTQNDGDARYWRSASSLGRSFTSNISTVQFSAQTRNLGNEVTRWATASHVHASGAFQPASSTREVKQNIEDAHFNATDIVNKINPITFRFKENEKYVIEEDPEDAVRLGILIEDAPWPLVDPADPSSVYGQSYDTLLAMSIQELDKRISKLEKGET